MNTGLTLTADAAIRALAAVPADVPARAALVPAAPVAPVVNATQVNAMAIAASGFGRLIEPP